MDMVVHRYQRIDDNLVRAAGIAAYAPVVATIELVEEEGAAVHVTLRDMKGNAGTFEAGQARHGGRRRVCGHGDVSAYACRHSQPILRRMSEIRSLPSLNDLHPYLICWRFAWSGPS